MNTTVDNILKNHEGSSTDKAWNILSSGVRKILSDIWVTTISDLRDVTEAQIKRNKWIDGGHMRKIRFALRIAGMSLKWEAPVTTKYTQDGKIDISQFEWSTQTRSCLHNESITTLEDLAQRNHIGLLRTPNFGRKCMNEVMLILELYGLKLSMTEEEIEKILAARSE